MPKITPPEVKIKAMELYLQGNLSGQQIVDEVNSMFPESTIKLSSIYHWIRVNNWGDQRKDVFSMAVENVKETEGQRLHRITEEHLTSYEGLRHKASTALDVLPFDRAYDAAKALDMSIQGERKVAEGMINLSFVQSVLNVLVEEIEDEDTIKKVALKLKTLVQTQE